MIIIFLLILFIKANSEEVHTRIINGDYVHIESHPYQASLEFLGDHICGAVIVTTTQVLTAAHCTDQYKYCPQLFRIRAGSTFLQSDGQLVSVTQIVQHPNFIADTLDYDICILILQYALFFGKSVQAIHPLEEDEEIPDNTLCYVTGWGASYWDGFNSLILQAVILPKYNDYVCNYVHSGAITPNMICFGYQDGSKDACSGDSGGPLVCNGRLAGITSWSQKCGLESVPGVYSKVSKLRKFLDSYIYFKK